MPLESRIQINLFEYCVSQMERSLVNRHSWEVKRVLVQVRVLWYTGSPRWGGFGRPEGSLFNIFSTTFWLKHQGSSKCAVALRDLNIRNEYKHLAFKLIQEYSLLHHSATNKNSEVQIINWVWAFCHQRWIGRDMKVTLINHRLQLFIRSIYWPGRRPLNSVAH